MNLRLDAIKFNHDPASASVDAFNIRKDQNVFVEAPEWRRGINLNPEDSPAAYSLLDTRGNTLTIQASFSCEDHQVDNVDIRALDGRLHPEPVINFIGVTLIADLLRPLLSGPTGNVLGEVEARNVKLTSGTSSFKSFNLMNVRIWNTGVGVQDIIWRWQYRIPPFGLWTDFATSTHRIYTTLTTPREPWQQSPFNSSNMQLPWAAVLDYACGWAATAQNPTDAARLITHSVYQLGREGIASYCKSSQYTLAGACVFKCAAFLFDLKLGILKLNCTDCATIVSTFANILGSELWQSIMVHSFNYNPILRIGESEWRGSSFIFHVVAWEEDCDVHNDVFDACLQIDGDDDPTANDADHVALLPTDLRFGKPNEKLYRDRLVAPINDLEAATPRPGKRKRRFIQSAPILECPMLSEEVLDFTARHFHFDFEQFAPIPDRLVSVDTALPGIVLDGWTELRSERLITTRNGTTQSGVISESLWRSSTDAADALLLITIYEGSSIQAGREWLHNSIAAIHSFEGVDKREIEPADAFFSLGDHCGIIFSSGNVVVSLVNVGKGDFPLFAIAQNLLQRLGG